MAEYIDNTFQQIALFFTLGTGYLDNLDPKKPCTLGACCRKSQLFSEKRFGELAIEARKVIKKD